MAGPYSTPASFLSDQAETLTRRAPDDPRDLTSRRR